MTILYSLKSGLNRALNVRKGVLIFWFSFFIMIMVFIFPFRGSLNSVFGSSMITEKLADGFDIEVFADLGPVLKSLVSFFKAGFMIIFLVGYLINTFITAGLFGTIKNSSGKFSSQEFFKAAVINFWSYFIITLIISLIIDFFSVIIIGVPALIASLSESISEKSAYMIVFGSIIIWFVFLPVFFLIADYARAWKASKINDSVFKATGRGFSLTFSRFWRSYFMMLILMIIQLVPIILIGYFLPAWKPVTAGGVFLLLIVSQLLILLRLFLKTWRYASVTSMMETDPVSMEVPNKY